MKAMESGEVKHGNILGVKISALTMATATEMIDFWITYRTPNFVCVAPAHSVMECHDHPELKVIFNQSGMTTPDGMAIVWIMHWLGFRHVERVYGPDLLLAVCAKSVEKGYRHYFYGGAPDVLEQLLINLHHRFPQLQVVGYDSPPFRQLSFEEEQMACERIRSAAPDIVWVGLGSPRQERWMAEYMDKLQVPVMVGVGAAFDFLSGRKAQAPRWIQRNGLEWLFRLATEPGRLWRRYIHYPRFVALVCLQMLGVKYS
jgi:N-acetylglucosaminyldiphosphoundecaprenol N-acetyl-beta-D-mannosaminyltransferase